MSLVSLRASNAHKLKEDDRFVCEFECENVDDALFFSDKSNVYKMKIADLPDCKASALGEYLPNILGMEEDERILYMAVTKDYSGYMLFAFENGKMAKVPMKSYETKTNRKKLMAAYSDKVPVVSILFMAADCEMAAFSDNNKILIFDTAKVPEKTTRSTQGVQVMTQNKGNKLVKVLTLDAVTLKDFEVYRTKNIPARGAYLKDEDMGQTSLM